MDLGRFQREHVLRRDYIEEFLARWAHARDRNGVLDLNRPDIYFDYKTANRQQNEQVVEPSIAFYVSARGQDGKVRNEALPAWFNTFRLPDEPPTTEVSTDFPVWLVEKIKRGLKTDIRDVSVKYDFVRNRLTIDARGPLLVDRDGISHQRDYQISQDQLRRMGIVLVLKPREDLSKVLETGQQRQLPEHFIEGEYRVL